VPQVVFIVAFVQIATFPCENAIAVLFVHGVLTLVGVAVGQVVLAPLALPVLEALAEIADVKAAVAPLVLAEAVWLAVLVLALVEVPVPE